jgi:uncharacterized membrane protein YeaQ/YmgE (transglycosylase-associated protein family)
MMEAANGSHRLKAYKNPPFSALRLRSRYCDSVTCNCAQCCLLSFHAPSRIPIISDNPVSVLKIFGASLKTGWGGTHDVTPGFWSFCSKVAVGWVGAWIGSPVLGHWPSRIPVLHYGDVWFVPAILGAAAVLIVAIDLTKMACTHASTS